MKRVREDDDDTAGVSNSEITDYITCNLPPQCVNNPTILYSQQEFENHYNNCHHSICSACRRVFPSEWILNVHITENHDPFTQVLKERGEKTVGGADIHSMVGCL